MDAGTTLTVPLSAEERRDVRTLIDVERRERNRRRYEIDFDKEVDNALTAYYATADRRQRRVIASRAYRQRCQEVTA